MVLQLERGSLMRGISVVCLGVALGSSIAWGQCDESFMRVRDDVPADTGLGVGQGVAVDGPFLVLANPFGEPSNNYRYGYLSVYRWDEQFQKWDYEQRVNPSNAGTNGPASFGWSMDIDGNTILAGSHQGLTTNFFRGRRILEPNPSTGIWSEIGINLGFGIPDV
ncbi:MAG: hypothetical protein R3B67_06995 [Phycisphaerales bacterium]